MEDFDQQPDVADDLFLLGIKCLTYAPHLLLTPTNLPGMVNCALNGLLVQHKDACCSILEFLVKLMQRSGSYPHSIPPTMHAVGQRFTHLLVRSPQPAAGCSC